MATSDWVPIASVVATATVGLGVPLIVGSAPAYAVVFDAIKHFAP